MPELSCIQAKTTKVGGPWSASLHKLSPMEFSNDTFMVLIFIKMKDVIPLFERLYPGAVAEFVFDQSSAHGAFAKDALNAK